MKKTAIVHLALMLGMATLAVAQTKQSPNTIAAGVRYLDPIFSNTSKTSDLVFGQAVNYSTNQMETLKLDLYEPSGDTAPNRPAIVWLHAGGFVQGDKSNSETTTRCVEFARRGYVSISINYRLWLTDNPDSTLCIRHAYEDAKASVRWLRANAAKYRIDVNRISIGGSSSGAVGAVHATYVEEEGNSGNPGYSSEVSACMDASGMLVDDNEIQIGEAPMLIAHGDQDTNVAYTEALELEAHMLASGIPYEFHTFPGEDHYWTSDEKAQFINWAIDFNYRYVIQTANGGVPVVTVNDVTLAEGNNGAVNAVFTVSLATPTANGQTVTLDYATADGSATAGSDYIAKSGSLSFPSGTTTQTVAVSVNGDAGNEGDESFYLNLKKPANARINDLQGRGTIQNDDTGGAPTLPTAPTNLSANAASATQVNLSWTDAASNEDGFRIERKSGSGAFVEIATASAQAQSYSDLTATASTAYTYRVRAFNVTGNSNYSNDASATTPSAPPTLPNAPTNLSANAISITQINLVWTDNATNEDGFRIERKSGSGAFVEIGTASAQAQSYSDMTVSASTAYTYRVRAYNVTGNSSYSNEASATTPMPVPTAPASLAASAFSATQINLSWSDRSNNEDGFAIERKTASTAFVEIATVAAQAQSYSDMTVSASTAYTYRVRAFNGTGNSTYSNEASATTPNPPLTAPAAPTSLAANVVNATRVDLSWSDTATNEDGFRIERKTASTAFAQIGTAAAQAQSYSDVTASANTAYTYRVRAYNAAGNSDYSNEANATTPNVPPAAPTSLVANAASMTKVNLSWTDNANNEDGFLIERKTANTAFAEIDTVAAQALSYADTTVSASTAYTYRVRAYNVVGNSNYSNEASATTPNPPPPLPDAPSNLAANAASATQVNLSWTDHATSEEGFRIERKTANTAFAQIGTAAAQAQSYSDVTASANTAYTYRVRAYNVTGNSDYSNEANATTPNVPPPLPTAPTSLAASAASAAQVHLTWVDNASSEEGFRIERKTTSTAFAEIGTAAAQAQSYSDMTVSAGTAYTYRVRAYNVTGNSNYSNEASATTPCNVVAAFAANATSGCGPLNVSFTDQSTGPVTSWAWNFGDGTTATAQHPTHTFNTPGTYTVTLTANSSTCGDGETKTGFITVTGAPTANFTATPTGGSTPLTANFTDQSTGGATAWSWNFGDGGTSTLQNPSHQYTTTGSFTVTLTASNGCGSDPETKTNYITINNTPTNVALNKPATASSSTGVSTETPAKAVDGSASTYWRSGTVSSTTITWLRVDLLGSYTCNRAVINWADTKYYARKYQVQVSNDDVNWTTVYTDNAGNAGIDDFTFPSTSARYARVYITENNKSSERIKEFEVYGVGGSGLRKDEPAAESVAAAPEGFELLTNYPNPFNPQTSIRFSLAAETHVRLRVVNALGQEVALLLDEPRAAGTYEIRFDAQALPTGVYFAVMQTGTQRRVHRLLFVK